MSSKVSKDMYSKDIIGTHYCGNQVNLFMLEDHWEDSEDEINYPGWQ